MLKIITKLAIGIAVGAVLAVAVLTRVLPADDAPPVATPKIDYTTMENQAILLRAATALGAINFCKQQYTYVAPDNVADRAAMRIDLILDASPEELATLSQAIVHWIGVAQQRGFLAINTVTPQGIMLTGRIDMDDATKCAIPAQYLQTLMQPGMLLETADPEESKLPPDPSKL